MNKRMIAGLICLLLMLQPLAGCGKDPAPSDPASGSPASGDHASNVPNVGVTAGVSA